MSKTSAAIKTPIVRLLDLTAGWSKFADVGKGVPDPAVPVDALCRLYQEAGELWNAIETNGLDEKEAVRAFVEQKVIPLLLR